VRYIGEQSFTAAHVLRATFETLNPGLPVSWQTETYMSFPREIASPEDLCHFPYHSGHDNCLLPPLPLWTPVACTAMSLVSRRHLTEQAAKEPETNVLSLTSNVINFFLSDSSVVVPTVGLMPPGVQQRRPLLFAHDKPSHSAKAPTPSRAFALPVRRRHAWVLFPSATNPESILSNHAPPPLIRHRLFRSKKGYHASINLLSCSAAEKITSLSEFELFL
jgi:hypothetical protein